MAMSGQDSIDTAGAPPADSSPVRFRVRTPLRAVLGLLLFAVICFVGGFGWFANHVSHLTTPADPGKADAIIVLTGGQSRLDAAMNLLESGKGQRLLISGVHPSTSQETLRAATGADRRLFNCCVDIDHAALDTAGNAEESAKWMQTHHFERVIVVTNNYHMPRSLLEMHRLANGAALEPYPVVNTRLDQGGWLMKPAAVRVIFTEYAKYVAALARAVLLPPPSTAIPISSGEPAQKAAGLR